MATYCVRGTQSYGTDPTSEDQPFQIDFEAEDDGSAKTRWPTLKPQGACWENVTLTKVRVKREESHLLIK
ncbi:MAG: hypothetical protein JWM39_1 [Parcubacteria group bacterium]|nr:hypothetical protein [Parcubacteria group bacterium]